jgi:hypothetical protein
MEETFPPAPKLSLSDRFKALLAEWGPLLLVVWFGLFGIVLVGFVLAIQLGFEVESTGGFLGTLGAAYVATQLTKPLRLVATVVITPALGAFLRRFRRSGEPEAGGSEPQPETAEAPAALKETPSEHP